VRLLWLLADMGCGWVGGGGGARGGGDPGGGGVSGLITAGVHYKCPLLVHLKCNRRARRRRRWLKGVPAELLSVSHTWEQQWSLTTRQQPVRLWFQRLHRVGGSTEELSVNCLVPGKGFDLRTQVSESDNQRPWAQYWQVFVSNIYLASRIWQSRRRTALLCEKQQLQIRVVFFSTSYLPQQRCLSGTHRLCHKLTTHAHLEGSCGGAGAAGSSISCSSSTPTTRLAYSSCWRRCDRWPTTTLASSLQVRVTGWNAATLRIQIIQWFKFQQVPAVHRPRAYSQTHFAFVVWSQQTLQDGLEVMGATKHIASNELLWALQQRLKSCNSC